MSRDRISRKQLAIHSKHLHDLFVSWVYNIHGKNNKQREHVFKELNEQWLDYCYKKNRALKGRADELKPQGFLNMTKDKESIKRIQEKLGLPKEKTFFEKIFA